MLLRKLALVVAVMAPFALSPESASAQKRMLGRVAAAHASVHDAVAFNKGQAAGQADLPAGIARVFDGDQLPPGIRRNSRWVTASQPEPEPEPEPEEEAEEEDDTTCESTVVFVNGIPTIVPC